MTLSFFPNDTLVEMACEPYRTCNIDQRSFKAYIARFMALTVKLAPFTAASIMPKLRSSAIAAARYCSFGEDRNTCGMRWTETEWDGLYGVGEQMSALEVIQSNMIHQVDGKELSTAEVGGTSKGNPAAGGDPNFFNEKARRIRARDKGGAAVLTVLTVGGFLAFGGWLSVGGI